MVPVQGSCEQDTDSLGPQSVPSVREGLEIGGRQVGLTLLLGGPWV